MLRALVLLFVVCEDRQWRDEKLTGQFAGTCFSFSAHNIQHPIHSIPSPHCVSTQTFATMTSYFPNPTDLSTEPSNAVSPGASNVAPRSTALSNRLTSVLSASYADSDIRDALGTLDRRGIKNTAEKRRQLRLDVQKEVLDCNGEIVADFGKVAEVSEKKKKRPDLRYSRLTRKCIDSN